MGARLLSVGDRVVRSSTAPLARDSVTTTSQPTWHSLLRCGLPNFALEGLFPILVFYGVSRAGGLAAGVAASAAVAGLVVLWQTRRGMGAALAAASFVFIAIQALVALAAHSATVYLAQPVLFSACWGIAYFVSIAIRRPLIGVFASAWYPFTPQFRASQTYRREFDMQSALWGTYCLARSGLRLGVLLTSGVGEFVAISAVTGTPILVALALWGIWHARRT